MPTYILNESQTLELFLSKFFRHVPYLGDQNPKQKPNLYLRKCAKTVLFSDFFIYLHLQTIFSCRRTIWCRHDVHIWKLLEFQAEKKMLVTFSTEIDLTYRVFAGESLRVQTLFQGFMSELLFLSLFQFFKLKNVISFYFQFSFFFIHRNPDVFAFLLNRIFPFPI